MNHCIYAYRVKEKSNHLFDICDIRTGLKQYAAGSIPEYWMTCNSKEQDEILCGINYYDGLLNSLEINDGSELDVRFVFLQIDHKKMMQERLIFLQKEYGPFDTAIQMFNSIQESLNVALKMELKYNVRRDKTVLSRLRDRVVDIKGAEIQAVNAVIEQLEMI